MTFTRRTEDMRREHEGTLRQFYKRADQPHYVDEWVMGLLLAD